MKSKPGNLPQPANQNEAVKTYLIKQADKIMKIAADATWAIAQVVLATRNGLRKLLKTNADQPPGFVEWCENNFAWSIQQAYRLIRLAEAFPDKPPPAALQKTASYCLTAPSAPLEALDEAITRAQGGETITQKIAQEIVQKYTPIIFAQPSPKETTAPTAIAAEVPAPQQQQQEVDVDDSDEDESSDTETRKPTRPRSEPYIASNGYRVVVYGEKGQPIDKKKVKAALTEAAAQISMPESQESQPEPLEAVSESNEGPV